MRVVALVNNVMGRDCVRVMVDAGVELVGLVVHPDGRATCRDEIIEAAELPSEAVFDGAALRDPEVLEAMAALDPHLGVSVFFGYILRPPFLRLFPAGVVNLHPSLLPWNRGAYPNVWSIVEGTPAGVTLHYVDEGVDTGDIIAQREIAVRPVDTGETLYHRLLDEGRALFQEQLPSLMKGSVSRTPQALHAGTHHYLADVGDIDEIDLDREYTARRLIDVLRARTFPPHAGAFFREGGRKIYLRLHLIEEQDLDD